MTITPGGRYDEAAVFTPVRIAVLTVSDTRDETNDPRAICWRNG